MDEKRINANDDLSEVGIHCSDVDLVQAGTNITTLLQESKTETFNDANEKIHTETEVLDSSISYSQKDGKSNFNLTKFNIYKNLLVITLSFLCLFMAYTSLEMLQSSLNVAGGLGMIGLTLVYTVKLLSSLFLPSLLFSKLGMKWTIVVAMFGYIAYIAASFHPTWGIVIPASVLIGIGGSNLWTGQMSYLSTLSQKYASMTGLKLSDAWAGCLAYFTRCFIQVGVLFSRLSVWPCSFCSMFIHL